MKKYYLTLLKRLRNFIFTIITERKAALLLPAFAFLWSAGECVAQPFAGNLKSVTITDAAGTNAPPVAEVKISTASNNPVTIQFDASSSTDPDGTIVSYHWDFGNGKTAEGKTVNYSYANDGEMQITLTVVDDGGAVSLASQKYEYFEIADNFETDSSANYTPLAGGITVAGGVAHGQAWRITQAYHKTALVGPDHWVQADLAYNGVSDGGGLMVRVNPTNRTGYTAYFSAGRIHLRRFVGTQTTWLAQSNTNYATGTYKVKLGVIGSTVTVYINGTQVISKIDTTYPAGSYVGIRFNRDSANADVTIDNLTSVSAQ